MSARLACRPATLGDAELLWRWTNDPETRRNSFTKAWIPHRQHRAWLEARLGSPASRLWIFSEGDTAVGQVRFDMNAGEAEVHITVAPERRGRGYGTRMLRDAIELIREIAEDGVPVHAWVIARNRPSLTLFTRCGFREVRTVDRDGEPTIVLELATAPARTANST